MEQKLYENLMNAITYLSAQVETLGQTVKGTTKAYLTISEAVKYVGLEEGQGSKIWKAVERGELSYYKPCRGYNLFKKDELDKWIENSKITKL